MAEHLHVVIDLDVEEVVIVVVLEVVDTTVHIVVLLVQMKNKVMVKEDCVDVDLLGVSSAGTFGEAVEVDVLAHQMAKVKNRVEMKEVVVPKDHVTVDVQHVHELATLNLAMAKLRMLLKPRSLKRVSQSRTPLQKVKLKVFAAEIHTQ